MAIEFIKVDEKTLAERETKPVVVKHDVRMLKVRRERFQQELDKIDVLLAEAVKLGIDEGPK